MKFTLFTIAGGLRNNGRVGCYPEGETSWCRPDREVFCTPCRPTCFPDDMCMPCPCYPVYECQPYCDPDPGPPNNCDPYINCYPTN